MKNNLSKIFENFMYLVSIVIASMFIYWCVKFSYYIVSSVYQALSK